MATRSYFPCIYVLFNYLSLSVTTFPFLNRIFYCKQKITTENHIFYEITREHQCTKNQTGNNLILHDLLTHLYKHHVSKGNRNHHILGIRAPLGTKEKATYCFWSYGERKGFMLGSSCCNVYLLLALFCIRGRYR
jgi:hypothetical protein